MYEDGLLRQQRNITTNDFGYSFCFFRSQHYIYLLLIVLLVEYFECWKLNAACIFTHNLYMKNVTDSQSNEMCVIHLS